MAIRLPYGQDPYYYALDISQIEGDKENQQFYEDKIKRCRESDGLIFLFAKMNLCLWDMSDSNPIKKHFFYVWRPCQPCCIYNKEGATFLERVKKDFSWNYIHIDMPGFSFNDKWGHIYYKEGVMPKEPSCSDFKDTKWIEQGCIEYRTIELWKYVNFELHMNNNPRPLIENIVIGNII